MIISDKKHLVLLERKLVILNCDGSIEWKFSEVTFPTFAEFLQDDMLLVEGSKKWYMICLKTGRILWSIPHTDRGLSSFSHVAINYNKMVLWRLFSRNCVYYLEMLDIEHRRTQNYRIVNYSGSLHSITISSSGEPLILNSIMVGENSERQQRNTILSFEFSRRNAKAVPQIEWYDPNGITSELFLCDSNTVLTSDLQIYHVDSGNYEPWIDFKGEWVSPSAWGVKNADFDKMRNLVFLRYNHADVIVDIVSKTIISQYFVNDSYGRIAFGKYWYYASKEIKCKEFPMFEQIPNQSTFFMTSLKDVINLHLEI